MICPRMCRKILCCCVDGSTPWSRLDPARNDYCKRYRLILQSRDQTFDQEKDFII